MPSLFKRTSLCKSLFRHILLCKACHNSIHPVFTHELCLRSAWSQWAHCVALGRPEPDGALIVCMPRGFLPSLSVDCTLNAFFLKYDFKAVCDE